MRLAERVLVEQEQLPERVEREMALRVLFLVYDAGRERLFVRLSLEDLLLDGTRGDEAVDETWFAREREPAIVIERTHILSSDHHATHGPGLAGRQQGSNLAYNQQGDHALRYNAYRGQTGSVDSRR